MICGDFESALAHCEAAVALAPAFPQAHYNMNVLLRRVGRQDEAVAQYWDLIEQKVGASIRPIPTPPSPQDSQAPDLPRATSPLTATPRGVSVVCVKWGTKYSAAYVNKLAASVLRHATRATSSSTRQAVAVDFVCLTEDARGVGTDEVPVRCLPLEAGWRGWWNKLQVFSPHVAAQLQFPTCVFLDLDTVIVDSIDALLEWDAPRGVLALLKTDSMANEQRRGGYNSSVMIWRNTTDERSTGVEGQSTSPFAHIYELMSAHFGVVSTFIYKFDHWLEVRVVLCLSLSSHA